MTALAAFETYTYSCDRTALAVFESNTTHMTVRRWRHLKLTNYPCGRTALAAFETNTYSCGGTALAAFETNIYFCSGTALAAFKVVTPTLVA